MKMFHFAVCKRSVVKQETYESNEGQPMVLSKVSQNPYRWSVFDIAKVHHDDNLNAI